MHTLQNLIVFALLVPGCTGFAAWKLMPMRARRALAASLLQLPHVPGALEARLRRAASSASGCGCDGCDHAEKKPAAQVAASQPITFQPRTLR
jgi:hypothetical protein